ncbi:sensor histidine kinase [Sphingomonas mollis]|uniref:sensor histidine kinase n=1 Tax=Sphingomonas mollis TaxID=2795726 RepID=UPI001E531179|nr:ATP-binding protein [Sphingomonas sp. BT553]
MTVLSRLWPRKLAGQIALLIALALFVAQAINFTLLLRERRFFALAQITGPAATRFADAIERSAQGRPPVADRGRVRLVSANPVPATLPREPEVEKSLRSGLAESGVQVGRIVTGLSPLRVDSPLLRRLPVSRRRFLMRSADELVIAVERPGLGWLVQRMPWGAHDIGLVWRLAGQTAILFVIVLLPVLWAVRRLSRPLRDLTAAAERFGPGEPVAPVAVSGPDDVAALITAFNGLRLRVTAMLDEKDRMLGAIGHDLRTPLAALRVRIESVEDEADRLRMIDTIADMNRTLDDILSLARLGRPSEPLTEVDLAALVDAVVEDFRDLGAPVSFEDIDRLRMRLRPALMRRAVRNLIENAVKYGEVAEVSLRAEQHAVAIVVADRGPGIPADRMGDVFDPFTRLETSRNRETGGIGLGLALARAIVREAGGEVVLANRPEGGLAATITLRR